MVVGHKCRANKTLNDCRRECTVLEASNPEKSVVCEPKTHPLHFSEPQKKLQSCSVPISVEGAEQKELQMGWFCCHFRAG